MNLAELVVAAQNELKFYPVFVDGGIEHEQTAETAAWTVVELLTFDELLAVILEAGADEQTADANLNGRFALGDAIKDMREFVTSAVIQLMPIQGLTLEILVERALVEFRVNPTYEDHGVQPQTAYTAVCEVLDGLSDVKVICGLIVEVAADERVDQSRVCGSIPDDDTLAGHLRPIVRSGIEQILRTNSSICVEEDQRLDRHTDKL